MTHLPRALRSSLLALALTTLAAGAAAQASAHERLTRIARAYVDAIAADDPIAATSLGLPGADGRLALASEPARAARIDRLRAWRAEVDAVAADATTLVDGNDVKLLRAEFDGELNELLLRESDRKGYAGPSLRLVARSSRSSSICRSSAARARARPTSTAPGTTSSPASSRGRRSSPPASAW